MFLSTFFSSNLKTGILILAFWPPLTTIAQNTYYSKDHVKLPSADSCYYYVKGIRDNLKSADTLTTFFCENNKVRSRSKLIGEKAIWFSRYYPNGVLKEEGRKEKRVVHMTLPQQFVYVGEVKQWYENGRMKSIESYGFNSTYNLIDYWDSTGVQRITNGTGFCGCVDNVGSDQILENGKYVNFKKDSVWTNLKNGVVQKVETYSMGTFIDGVSYRDGKEYPYKVQEQPAEFKEGLEAMYRIIGRNLTYPKSARKARIEGTVYVSFVVEKNGEISNLEVVKGISSDCDNEAVRCISMLRPWNPGRQYGLPVKSKFVLPIKFKL